MRFFQYWYYHILSRLHKRRSSCWQNGRFMELVEKRDKYKGRGEKYMNASAYCFINGDYAFVDYNQWYEEHNTEPFYVEIRNEYEDNRSVMETKFYKSYDEALKFANSLGIKVNDNVSI